MFRNTYQSGFLSILYSIGSKPLQIWDKKVRNGHIKRLSDEDIASSVLELSGSNVSTTYITCPAKKGQSLGIKLPFLVMIVKNMKKYFTFEVTVLDDKNVHRRFRASNYSSATRVKPFITTMPMRLDEGWNQIQFNLNDFTRRAYGTNYIETVRVQIHANVRIRRIYFADRLYSEKELPREFLLYLPPTKAAEEEAAAQADAQGQMMAMEDGRGAEGGAPHMAEEAPMHGEPAQEEPAPEEGQMPAEEAPPAAEEGQPPADEEAAAAPAQEEAPAAEG